MDIAWKQVSHYCEEADTEEDGNVFKYAVDQPPIYCFKTWICRGEIWELPPHVRDSYKSMKASRGGFFPEIERAWTVVDNTLLLLWSLDKRDGQVWEHRSEEQRICGVGLVKSRPGLVEAPQYLLVVATGVDLLLFGVCYCSKDGQISVQKLVDYTISISDGITCMACTDKGRIFLGGHSGHIYELLYTTGRPFIATCERDRYGVVEMVVDNERKILYVVKEKKILEAYYLGMNGERPIKNVGKCDLGTGTGSIVCVSPLSRLETKWSGAHVTAVLSDGSRVLLSTSSGSDGYGYGWVKSRFGIKNQTRTPNCLRELTTKFPPKAVKSDNTPVKPETASFSDGTLFLHYQLTDSTTCVLVGKDSSLDDQSLREIAFTIWFEGRLVSVADVLPTPDTCSTMVSLYSQVLGESYENTCRMLRGRGALFNQHILPRKKIYVFSTFRAGEVIFNRPVDILIEILKSSKRVLVDDFIHHFGADETAAMCLMLASGIISDDEDSVRKMAGELFQDMRKMVSKSSATNPILSALFQDMVAESANPILSAAHNGLYICTARLLYPIWNTCVMSGDGVSVMCRFLAHVLQELELKLRWLEQWISDAEDENLSIEDAYSVERCRHLILRSAEALFLLQVLSGHGIAIHAEESLQQSLLKLKFCQLVHDDKIVEIIKRLPDSESVLLNGCPAYFKASSFSSPIDSSTFTTPRPPHPEIRKRANRGTNPTHD